MRKLQHVVLSFCLILSLFFYPSMEANASNVSLGVSASTINIGDTVTVSVTVPDSVSATIDLTYSSEVLSFVSATADVGANGSTITMNVGKYSLAATTSISVTFKAKTSGTASLSASVVSAVDNDTAEEVSLGGASTSITVQNQAVEQPETPPADTPPADTPETPPADTPPAEEPKSEDNSLAKLKLSSGTLSPSFVYNVTNYTATVGYNVTNVVVSATPSNAKATIVSVTGNGNVNLEVGENTIQVVVQAENGVKATYTIVVTRQAEGTTQPDPSESESGSESEDTPVNEYDNVLQWNGQNLQPAEDIPNEMIPVDFNEETVVVNSVEIPSLTFANGDLKLLYLANEEGVEGLYVYDEVQQMVYPFVKLETNDNYIMVLLPDAVNAPAPENHKACTLSIEGKGVINAYQFVQPEGEAETTSWFGAETFYAAQPVATDFYLIYGMNNAGEIGWYVYDSVEGTIQRYLGSVHTPVLESETATGENTENIENPEDYDKLVAELEAAKNMQMIIICVAVFVVAVLVIIIVNLILKNRSDEEYEEDYDDENDEYYEEYELEEDEDTTKEMNSVADASVETDDEIEIEFYEMPQKNIIPETVVEEDDEVEIEFYEMTEISSTKLSSTEVTENNDEVEVEFYDMEALLLKEAIDSEEAPSKTEKEIPMTEAQVAPVKVENAYVDDDDDDDLEFIELD